MNDDQQVDDVGAEYLAGAQNFDTTTTAQDAGNGSDDFVPLQLEELNTQPKV